MEHISYVLSVLLWRFLKYMLRAPYVNSVLRAELNELFKKILYFSHLQ